MAELLRRLRERKLVQWALAYAAASFALLQGVDIVAQRFGWPEAIERGLIVAIVVGFFATLVLAWYHGERGEQRATGTELVILTLLLAIGGALLWRVAQTSRGAADAAPAVAVSDKSIAVLPFASLSEDKSNAYFADGMQDEILTRLAQIGSLRVSSRTSTAQFANGTTDIAEVARKLGVANVLEGSVEKSANRVRINVQLIRAADNTHVWADIYDRTLDDVFGVQGEVSKAIADALGAKLTGREQQRVAAIPTRNEVAYDAWLRGLAFYSRSFQNKAYVDAAAAFREAVAADPDFAEAWALLARVEGIEYFFGIGRDEKNLEMIRSALANAERLAPDLYETKAARAYYVYRVEEDYPKAVALFEALNRERPGDTEVLITLGFLSGRRGDWDGARARMDEALRLDPTNVRFFKLQAAIYMYGHRPDDALKILQRVQEIVPGERESLQWRADALLEKGDLDRAAEVLDLAKIDPEDPWPPYIEVLRYQRRYAPAIAWLEPRVASGTDFGPEDAVDARVCLAETKRLAGDATGARADYARARDAANTMLVEQATNEPVLTDLAFAQAGLGDAKAALAALERADALVAKSGDAIDRGRNLDTRARVELQLGHKEQAIDALRQALTAYYGGTTCTLTLSPAMLKLDPEFDVLRGDPRFEALLAK